MENRKIKLEDMLPIIEEKLSAKGTVEIPITGTSMLPLLVQGRDTVVLKSADTELRKYDIPLYRRKDGHFVLHRVMKVQDGMYSMCGDNQWVIENGIEHSQVIGVVCSIKRNGKVIDLKSFKYRLYCGFWKLLFPIRKYIVRLR